MSGEAGLVEERKERRIAHIAAVPIGHARNLDRLKTETAGRPRPNHMIGAQSWRSEHRDAAIMHIGRKIRRASPPRRPRTFLEIRWFWTRWSRSGLMFSGLKCVGARIMGQEIPTTNRRGWPAAASPEKNRWTEFLLRRREGAFRRWIERQNLARPLARTLGGPPRDSLRRKRRRFIRPGAGAGDRLDVEAGRPRGSHRGRPR